MPAPGQQQQSSSPVQCGESPELGAPASEAAAATCGVVDGEGSGNQTTTKARATSLLLLQLSSLTRSSAVSEARLGAGISPPAKLAADFAGNLIAQMAA